MTETVFKLFSSVVSLKKVNKSDGKSDPFLALKEQHGARALNT